MPLLNITAAEIQEGDLWHDMCVVALCRASMKPDGFESLTGFSVDIGNETVIPIWLPHDCPVTVDRFRYATGLRSSAPE